MHCIVKGKAQFMWQELDSHTFFNTVLPCATESESSSIRREETHFKFIESV